MPAGEAPAAPEFSSLLVSRPLRMAPAIRRARGIVLAGGFYGAAGLAVLVSPYVMPELVRPPEAGLADPRPPDRRIEFPRTRWKGGDGLPAGPVRHGRQSGPEDRRRKGAQRPAAPVVPLAEPQPADVSPNAPVSLDERADDGGGQPGDSSGEGVGPGPGEPGSTCLDCTGTGKPGPGLEGPGWEDGPLGPATPGLIAPRIIPSSRALPQYPAPARRTGLMGTVILLVVVEADGRVGQIQVIRSPDQRWGFDLAAIGAVKEWRYEPALMNGRPVAAYITVMVEFTLSR